VVHSPLETTAVFPKKCNLHNYKSSPKWRISVTDICHYYSYNFQLVNQPESEQNKTTPCHVPYPLGDARMKSFLLRQEIALFQ
jgi:hypothetical protein